MRNVIVIFLFAAFSLFSQEFSEVSTNLPGLDRASIAWGDYDGDGDLDILMSGSSHTEIYRNDNGSFTALNAGLIGLGYGSVEWGDFDNDGDIDLLVSGWDGSTHTKVYKNTNGIFEDINAGLPGILHGVSTWGDYDNDGDLDVFVTGNTNSSGYISKLYRNEGGIYTDTGYAFPGLIYSNATWGDYNDDGFLDLIVTGNTGSYRITNLYKNVNGNFTSVTHSIPAVESGPVDWGDFDCDGDLDLLLTGWTGSEVITDIYRNDGDYFTALNTGMTKMYAGSTDWGDYDNDGDLDALILGYSAVDRYVKIYNNNNSTFTDINGGFPGVRWGWARWGDYDSDGDLDFIMNGSDITKIFENIGVYGSSVPETPTALNSSAVSDTEFTANWLASSGADGYKIDLSTDSLFTNFTGEYQDFDLDNSLNYQFTGLFEETIYYYRLKAYNAYGESGYSNTIKTITRTEGSFVYGPDEWGIWSAQGSPYYIYGDINIPDGEKLTIEPGVEIIFMGHYRINVQGCIDASGFENDSIIFRAHDPVAGWMGIRFIDTPGTNPKSKLSYCILKDGNANDTSSIDCYGGAVSLQNYSNVDITNNLFTNNRAGAGSAINCYTSSPLIKNNIFKLNRAGYTYSSGYGTINCMFGSEPMIMSNLFEDNWLIGENYCAGAAIRCVFDSNAHIKNNIIRNNWIESDGNLSEGTAMYIHSSDPLILNNLIYDNYIYPATGHGSGGAIFFYNSNAKLINNTIKTNSAREGGALWFKLSSPDFHNNIIRGNIAETIEEQIFFDDDESDPNFYHNNIEGGKENFGYKESWFTFTGAWINNIDEEPKYVNNGNGLDFNLASDSPCIDSGSLDYVTGITIDDYDLLNNVRVFGNEIDMGAIESFVEAPGNIRTECNGITFSITWDYVNEASGYNVYSSDSLGGPFVLEATVVENSINLDMSVSTKKFYIIKSIN